MLTSLTKQVQDKETALEALKTDYLEAVSATNGQLASLERDKKVLSQVNIDLAAENRDLKSAISVHKEELSRLKSQETAIQEQLNDLQAGQTKLTEEIKGSEARLTELTEQIAEAETKQAASREQYNKDVSILEQKKQALTQEIMDNRAEDDKVRDNLAKWSKRLEDQDKNLRIREAKVSEQEKAVIRNYNLLNM